MERAPRAERSCPEGLGGQARLPDLLCLSKAPRPVTAAEEREAPGCSLPGLLCKPRPPALGAGCNDNCADVETNAPSDSDGTTEDDESQGASVRSPSGVDHQLPRWVHCQGPSPMEPCWVPLPTGFDARQLRAPVWGSSEPAVLDARVARAPAHRAPPPGLPPVWSTGPTPAVQEEPPRPAPKTCLRTVVSGDGRTRVSWVVDAKKLQSKDQVIVSSPFDILVGRDQVPFKLMLCPRTVSDRRGGHCFKKARGVGFVQLKCEAGVDGAPRRRLAFRLSVGQEPQRGPVTHDFAQEGIAGLPEDKRHWDLTRAVDAASQTLTVELEALQIYDA